MSDDLERLLRDVAGRVPTPDPAATRRVRERVLGIGVRPRRRVSAAVVATLAVGMGLGYWAIPREEPAIGAADPPQIAITATPNVVKMYTAVEVRGRIVARKAGEQVTVEENACGRGWLRTSGEQTNASGEFQVTLFGVAGVSMNSQLRARWAGQTSNVVRVSVRPSLLLRQKSRATFKADVSGSRRLSGRMAQLERYDKASNRWRIAARARLRGTSGAFFEVAFRARLRKGTIVRAAIPRAQAAPCHIAGFSNMMTVA